MDRIRSLNGDKDEIDCYFSCADGGSQIKKSDNYKETISKALNYNECKLIFNINVIFLKSLSLH